MNIAFRIELERIFAGVTRCVLPNNPFPLRDCVEMVMVDPELAKSSAESKVRRHPWYKDLAGIGLDVVANPTLLSRVLKMTMAPEIQVFVCRSDWKGELEGKLERLRKVEIKALKSGDEREWAKMVRAEGKILGYPRCCIDRFVRGKLKSEPQETRIIAECIEEGILGEIYSLLREPSEPKEELFVFFTSNFYPCEIGCERALKIGLAVRESLEGKLRRAYELKVILNSSNLLMSAYSTYRFVRRRGGKTEFGRLVEEFFRDKDLKFLESVFTAYSSNPLGFEDGFISARLD